MPRTESHEGIALRTNNPADRIALRGVRLLARLSGMGLRATVEQTFVNLESRAIEAVYTFPLPESAAVCGFEVITAERVLTGTIDEAGKAEETYHEAIAQGDGAFIAEQHRPDVFSVRVGNLKPRQAATIRLTYLCALEKVDRQIRVAFPTTIAPRYATATATDPIDAMIDGEALNPPHVLTVPYGLTLRAEIDLGREVVGVLSPTHAIDVSQDEAGRSVVSLTAGITEMNRDVVLSLRLAKEAEPRVQAATGPDGANYLAVTFVPEFDDADLGAPSPSETIFVLDCSGSMMGESIQQAKAALELCLRSLSPGDTFNICRFGSSFELMASEPLPYTQQTLDAALKYVRASGDLGGTELHAPLEAILKIKPRAGTVRQIILLTDGQVTNEPALVELCRGHRRHNRIFSFGIGAACSQFLVKGVARATGGAAEFITEGERIDDKVLRTFARLASPAVSDVSIDWAGADVQTLAELPPVFDGDVMAVYGRCGGALPSAVTLNCKVGDQPRSWRLQTPRLAANDGGTIATLWARRTIQSLEEVNGSAMVRHHSAKPSREQETIIRLSRQFNLLSSLTMFICIEHRSPAERNSGEPALRRVPVMLPEEPAGTGIMGLVDTMSTTYAAAPRAMPAPAAAVPGSAKRSRGLLGKLFGGKKRSRPRRAQAGEDNAVFGAPMEEATAAAPPAPATGGLRDRSMEVLGSGAGIGTDLSDVLRLQQADGAFRGSLGELDELLASEGGGAWEREIRAALPGKLSADDVVIVSTVLALLLLTSAFGSDEAAWSRAARKASRLYLPNALGMTVVETEQWLAKLKSQLLTKS